MVKMKEVSTRRMQPSLPELDVDRILETCRTWSPELETDGTVTVHDGGLAVYTLVDPASHWKYYAALILGKASLKCTLAEQEPKDVLGEGCHGKFHVTGDARLDGDAQKKMEKLMDILGKKGYTFG